MHSYGMDHPDFVYAASADYDINCNWKVRHIDRARSWHLLQFSTPEGSSIDLQKSCVSDFLRQWKPRGAHL